MEGSGTFGGEGGETSIDGGAVTSGCVNAVRGRGGTYATTGGDAAGAYGVLLAA